MNESKKKLYQVTIGIQIIGIKLEDQSIIDPQALTLLNNNKEQFNIPFETPLKYKFESVEQQMIFKFAILGKGDLLGFLYIEIPERYKKIKNFKIDDWFPIKQIEIQDQINVKLENFLARVIIIYKSSKKMTFQDRIDAKIEQKVGYQKIAKNLKRRMVEIYRDVDKFEDRNKEFLKNFEQKMLKKRQKMRKTKSQSSYKPLKNGKNFLNKQKTTFYLAKDKLSKTQDIKNFGVKQCDLYPFVEKQYGNNNLLQHKQLLAELSQAKQEIIRLRQTIQKLKDGQLTVDNKKMKEILKEQQKQIEIKQQKNFYLENEQEQILQNKQNLLETQYIRQYQDIEKSIKDHKISLKNFSKQKKQFSKEQETLNEDKKQFQKLKQQFEKKLQHMIQKEKKFKQDKEEFKDVQIEFDEIKQRLMIERQQMMQQAKILQNNNDDYDIQKIQIKNQQQILLQEMNNFNKEQQLIKNQNDEQSQRVQQQLYELQQKINDFEIKKKQFMQEHGGIIKEKKMLKNEGVRLWNDRFELQEQQKKYQMWKQQVESTVQNQLEQLEQDFQYIEDQLETIERNKKEFDFLKNNLEQFQRFLIDQQNIQNSQMQNFQQVQDQFFLKFNDGISLDELEDFQIKFKMQYEKFIKERKDQVQLFQEIEQQKREFLKHINKITMEVENEQIHQQRRNTEIRKKNTISRQLIQRNDNMEKFEKEIQIKIDAEKIVNQIIDKASNNYYRKDTFPIQKKATFNVNLTDQSLQELDTPMIKSQLYKFIDIKKYKLDKENYQNFRTNQIENFMQNLIKDLMESLDQLEKNNVELIIDIKNKYDDEYSKNEIKLKYEQKIKLLVEYIESLKKNSNFFNNNIDSKILIGKKGSFINKQIIN